MKANGRYRRGRAGQRGLVLVIVLWIVALLAVMAGAFAYSMRVETRLATSAVERARARALAEAGIAYALAWQLNPDAQKQWPPNGDPRNWEFGGGRLQIRVVDAAGLVNLNTADAELKALLAAAGVNPKDQDRLMAAIQDWRDPDDQPVPHGAESADYRAAGRTGPKNAPFESIEELQQVLGMTGEIYGRIAGVVTVFSNHTGINPELAPAGLLQSLGLDERTVADYMAARARTTTGGLSPTPLRAGKGRSFFSQNRSNIYHIAVEAATETGTAARVEAVYAGQGVAVQQGVRLLSWREGR